MQGVNKGFSLPLVFGLLKVAAVTFGVILTPVMGTGTKRHSKGCAAAQLIWVDGKAYRIAHFSAPTS